MPRPTDEWYRNLHERLRGNDPTAPSDLFNQAMEDLAGAVASRFPRHRDSDELHDAVVEALMAYVLRPEMYDPSRATLRGYLVLAIRRDLQNILEKRGRRSELEELAADVELHVGDRKEGSSAPTLEDLLASAQLIARARLHLTSATDRQILDLLIEGERSTEAYARILDIASLPSDEQRAAVKRCKDRIKVLLRRHWSEIDAERDE